jgi:MFS family permease
VVVEAAGGALRSRNYRLFLAGQTVSNVGTWFQTLAQSLLIIQLTGSGAELGAVAALQFAPLLLLGGIGGAVADQRDCRRVLACTSGAAAAVTATLGVVTISGHGSVGALWLTALSLGVLQAFDRPAAQAFISELVPPEQVANGVSLFTVSVSAARLIGPAVGGLLYATNGPGGCFLINAGSFVLALGSVLAVRRDLLFRRAAHIGGGGVRSGFRYAWQDPSLRVALLGNAFVGLLAFNFATTITALVSLTLHGSSVDVGFAHAANAVGAVAGGIFVGRKARVGERHVARWCAGLGTAMLAVAPLSGVFQLLLLAPALGLAIGGYQASIASFIQLRAQPHMLGRMLSLMTMGSTGTTAIGAVLVGWLVDVASARAAFLVGGASCLLAALTLAGCARSPGASR